MKTIIDLGKAQIEIVGTPETLTNKAFCIVNLILDGQVIGSKNSLVMQPSQKFVKLNNGNIQNFSDQTWGKIMDAINAMLSAMPKVSDAEKQAALAKIQKEKAYEMLQTEGHGYDYDRFGNDSLEQD
jgi:hypothetical protein